MEQPRDAREAQRIPMAGEEVVPSSETDIVPSDYAIDMSKIRMNLGIK